MHFPRMAIQLINSDLNSTRTFWRDKCQITDAEADAMKQAGTGALDEDDTRRQLQALKEHREANAS